jgi:small-conductance mechanosensitive channel
VGGLEIIAAKTALIADEIDHFCVEVASWHATMLPQSATHWQCLLSTLCGRSLQGSSSSMSVRIAREGGMRDRSLIVLASAVTLACYLLAERSQTNGIIGLYRERLSVPMFACWLAGFVAATISPATCAVFFWSNAKRLRRGWIMHLLLVPAMWTVDHLCASLMLFAADEPDLDSLTGHALLPAMLLMMICSIGYFVSLGVRKLGARRRVKSIGGH